MLLYFIIIIVLCLITLPVICSAHCFHGGTSSCQFDCHCADGAPCTLSGVDSGNCPDSCANQTADGSFQWYGDACQLGNLALGTSPDVRGLLTGHGDSTVDGVLMYDDQCVRFNDNYLEDSTARWDTDFGTGDDWFVLQEVDVYGNVSHGITAKVVLSGELEAFNHDEDYQMTRSHLNNTVTSLLVSFDQPRLVQHLRVIFLAEQPSDGFVHLCEVAAVGYKYVECGFSGGDYRFGAACLRRCHCQNLCNPVTGACADDCMPGYSKTLNDVCNSVCDVGRWGLGCKTMCNCEGECNPVNGECSTQCVPGYFGASCQEPCDSNHWGSGCTKQCNCDAKCDVVTGLCPANCSTGYYGRYCQHRCREYTFGRGNESGCFSDCNCLTPCDRKSGHCTGGCVPGFEGGACQQPCSGGWWGGNCRNRCTCQNVAEICNRKSGSCVESGCQKYYTGEGCGVPIPRLDSLPPPIIMYTTANVLLIQFIQCNLNSTDVKSIYVYKIQFKCQDDVNWTEKQYSISHVSMVYNIAYATLPQNRACQVRVMPFIVNRGTKFQGEPSPYINVHTECKDFLWGVTCSERCRCADVTEVCNKTTGYCASGCAEPYYGAHCDAYTLGLQTWRILVFVLIIVVLMLIGVGVLLYFIYLRKLKAMRKETRDVNDNKGTYRSTNELHDIQLDTEF